MLGWESWFENQLIFETIKQLVQHYYTFYNYLIALKNVGHGTQFFNAFSLDFLSMNLILIYKEIYHTTLFQSIYYPQLQKNNK